MYTDFKSEEDSAYGIEFYRTPRGDYPVKSFLESLQDRPRAKTAAWLRLLQKLGPNLGRPYADVLRGPIRELRISFGRLGIRLLYFIHGDSIVITHGFLKKDRKMPPAEIARSMRCRNAWLAASAGGRP